NIILLWFTFFYVESSGLYNFFFFIRMPHFLFYIFSNLFLLNFTFFAFIYCIEFIVFFNYFNFFILQLIYSKFFYVFGFLVNSFPFCAFVVFYLIFACLRYFRRNIIFCIAT